MVVGKDLAKHLIQMVVVDVVVVVVVVVFGYFDYHDNVQPPMAATPSDSACFVSSKVSLKLQPETCKILVERKTLRNPAL